MLNIITINLSPNELKLITKGETKTKINFSENKIKDIKQKFNKSRYKFSKSKIKGIKENIFKLEESLFKLKRYYDHDDIEYKGIRDIENLFNQSTDEDYHKPIKTLCFLAEICYFSFWASFCSFTPLTAQKLSYFFVILDRFLSFYPLTTLKIKILSNCKKPLEISSSYICGPKIMIR